MDTQPYVIAVASEKGGVGKSTLAASLATYWASIGYRVLCADLDPQGTLLEWDGVGSDAAGEGRPTVIPVANNVRRSLPQVWSGYDIVVMDTPGRMDQRLGEALMIADFVLIPVPPGAPDLWALGRVIQTVLNAKSLRPELRAVVVVNRAINTRVANTALEALEEMEDIELAPMRISNRAAIAEAVASGSGVTAFASGSVAALEMRKLGDWILEPITQNKEVSVA